MCVASTQESLIKVNHLVEQIALQLPDIIVDDGFNEACCLEIRVPANVSEFDVEDDWAVLFRIGGESAPHIEPNLPGLTI